MKILLMVMIAQSLNLVIFARFNRVEGLRTLALRQQLTVCKRKSNELKLSKVGTLTYFANQLSKQVGINGEIGERRRLARLT